MTELIEAVRNFVFIVFGGIVLFFKFTHKHRWKTTHCNPWIHPTKQKCRCGLTRSFEYKKVGVKGPLWKQGEWVWSNGKTSEYSCLD